jgi:hypothetical protein
MANAAQYTKNVRRVNTTLSAANALRDGTGTIVTNWIAPAFVDASNPGGARIERIMIAATGTTTAGMIRIFTSDSAAANSATNTHLYYEVPVTAITPSATVGSFDISLQAVDFPSLFPIILGPNETLRFSTNNAEAFRITTMGGDY